MHKRQTKLLSFIDQLLPNIEDETPLPPPTEGKRPINCWRSKPRYEENNQPIPNYHYCSVKGLYLNKTEKSILLLKNHKTHWFPLSVLLTDDSLNETKVIIVIDIPSWLARKHSLAIGYDPVTKKGKEFNQTIGFEGYGLYQQTNHRQGSQISENTNGIICAQDQTISNYYGEPNVGNQQHQSDQQ